MLFPFISAVISSLQDLFQVSFFFGYTMSKTLFYLLNMLFPPPGLGVQVDFELVDGEVVIGQADVGTINTPLSLDDSEKGVEAAEQKLSC
ncbi:hypothetical protein F5X96DRAFT_629666, partial [Biscogniauxia mediterranea]